MNSRYRVDVYQTNLKTLDILLDGGLPQDSIVLITGEPGTGKTTLALQILAEAAEKKISSTFLTFDEDPEMAFHRFQKSYSLDSPQSNYRFVEEPRRLPTKKDFLRIATNPSSWLSSFSAPISSPKKDLGRLFNVVNNCGIWVIDGLNCLLDELSDGENDPARCLRHLQHNIRRVFLQTSEKGDDRDKENVSRQPPQLVIVTTESKSDRMEYLYESYMADVVIELGYRDFVPDRRFPNVKERLLVCSTPKGRGIHVQRREVCYEFVPGEGLRFFPTYPATGQLSLFAENKPQEQLITDFSEADVPTLFPDLTVREFGRANLYHEYSIRRRKTAMPWRYDFRGSSLDEYWTSSLRPLLARLPIAELRPYSMDISSALIEEIRKHKTWLTDTTSEPPAFLAVPYIGNVGLFVVHADAGVSPAQTSDGVPFLTWEQIEESCREVPSVETESPLFAIETKTLDSFVAFVLELCWSHLGGWFTKKNEKGDALRVKYEEGHDEKGTVAALARFHRWIHDYRILRPHCTLSVGHRNAATRPRFSRHWYSTLVDSLTRQRDREHSLRVRDIRVFPIPIPKVRATDPELSCTDFHSAWGEWYLGAWRGTENVDLAVELINTMTSSRWQINAAMTGASLPLYEPFFDEFGNCQAFCTDWTYNNIRKCLYAGAFSRANFDEYRFVMQKFFAGVKRLTTDRDADPARIWKNVVDRIVNWSSEQT